MVSHLSKWNLFGSGVYSVGCRHCLAALLVLLVAAGCTKKGPKEGAGEPDPAKRTLKLGAVLSQTGPAATIGDSALRGLRLALNEINKSEDLRVDLKVYDSRTDPNEAAKLVQQAAQVDRLHAIVGPSTSPNSLRVGPLLEDMGISAMTPTATHADVTSSGARMSRVCFVDPFQGEALAIFLRENLKKTTAVLLVDKANDYSVGLASSFRQTFTKLGGKLAAEEHYTTGTADFSALITKIARYEAEALVIPGWYSDVGPMLKQAGDKWDKFTLLGGDAWDSPQLFELSAGNIRNAYISTHYAVDDEDSLVKSFVASYEKLHGAKPDAFAALGYDAGLAMADAARRAAKLDRDAMTRAINSIKGLKGVTGVISLNERRDAVKPATIVEVLPSGYRFRTRISPR